MVFSCKFAPENESCFRFATMGLQLVVTNSKTRRFGIN